MAGRIATSCGSPIAVARAGAHILPGGPAAASAERDAGAYSSVRNDKHHRIPANLGGTPARPAAECTNAEAPGRRWRLRRRVWECVF